MDACRACGARLAPGMAWCGQCYTPIAAPAAPVPAFAGRRLGMAGAPPPAEPVHAPEYSRWKAGATSMGWLGRALSTLGVLIVAAFLYLYAFPVMVGIEDARTRLLYLGFASPAILYVLARVWRPTRIR